MPVASLRSSLLCLTVAAGALGIMEAGPADASARSAFISDTNQARTNHDRRDYRVRDDLNSVAERWADWMADHNTLEHNPNLGSQVHGWRALGENVGCGPGERSIQRAFMASQSHRQNILSRTYTQVGIGTSRSSNGTLYVDEIFRRPAS